MLRILLYFSTTSFPHSVPVFQALKLLAINVIILIADYGLFRMICFTPPATLREMRFRTNRARITLFTDKHGRVFVARIARVNVRICVWRCI